jgi:uncharacterized protein (TIGR02611 family)
MDDAPPDIDQPASTPARRLYRLPWVIGVALVGMLTIIIGIILIPGPGPGWLIVYAGVGILATEFPWARRLMHWIRDRFQKLVHRFWKKKDKDA